MPKGSAYTASLNWNFILDKIEREQCLLVLGPEAYVDNNGVSYTDKLQPQLDPDHNDNVYRFYKDDGFFLFEDTCKRTLVCHEIANFYEQALPSEPLKLIAEIPFHVMLTVTPDKLLNKAFDEQRFVYQFGYYKKGEEPQINKPPTKQNPLVYNLFGCLESEESLVLSHNDLYDYFKSIFAKDGVSMPKPVKSQLRHIRSILFLGVPFDKWYMQLLLRELEIHNTNSAFLRFAANQSLSGDIQTFCTEQFKINFIFNGKASSEGTGSGNAVAQFIQDLHERCLQRGLKRKEAGITLPIADQIRNQVKDGKLEEAISLLLDCTAHDADLNNEAIKLSGRYKNFKRRDRGRMLREEEKAIQESQITGDILSLINELPA
jgi:hypothetical protein